MSPQQCHISGRSRGSEQEFFRKPQSKGSDVGVSCFWNSDVEIKSGLYFGYSKNIGNLWVVKISQTLNLQIKLAFIELFINQETFSLENRSWKELYKVRGFSRPKWARRRSYRGHWLTGKYMEPMRDVEKVRSDSMLTRQALVGQPRLLFLGELSINTCFGLLTLDLV